VTAAGAHSHVLVVSKHNVGNIVKVEHGHGTELGGGTAGLGSLGGLHQVHECLHDGVVCRVHVRIQWK
jgi:hypothetical protein